MKTERGRSLFNGSNGRLGGLSRAVLNDEAVTKEQLDERFDIKNSVDEIDLTGPRRFIFIEEDSTNGGEPTVYFFDGSVLNWVIMQPV